MDLYGDYRLVSMNDSEIVQEKSFGKCGRVIFKGNTAPDMKIKQKLINDVGIILLRKVISDGE